MAEIIKDQRDNADLKFLEPGKYCPRCKMSFNEGPFKILWRPPDLEEGLAQIMQCNSCRMLFAWK